MQVQCRLKGARQEQPPCSKEVNFKTQSFKPMRSNGGLSVHGRARHLCRMFTLIVSDCEFGSFGLKSSAISTGTLRRKLAAVSHFLNSSSSFAITLPLSQRGCRLGFQWLDLAGTSRGFEDESELNCITKRVEHHSRELNMQGRQLLNEKLHPCA